MMANPSLAARTPTPREDSEDPPVARIPSPQENSEDLPEEPLPAYASLRFDKGGTLEGNLGLKTTDR